MKNIKRNVTNTKLNFYEFKQIYDFELQKVLGFLTVDMQKMLAKHNYGWRVGETNFEMYLTASAKRFYKAYESVYDSHSESVCDIGGFWGIFPIVLAKIGIKNVAMTEALEYYDSAFDDLFDYIRSKGVEIIDTDPFAINESNFRKYDFVSALAVIEHYPHSLKIFMDNFKKLMTNDGCGYIEVPNIAYLPKRLSFLFGISPLSSLRHIYKSEVPFTGHHHEFVIEELYDLAELSELKVVTLKTYNYSIPDRLYYKVRHPIINIVCSLSKSCRECVAIAVKKVKII